MKYIQRHLLAKNTLIKELMFEEPGNAPVVSGKQAVGVNGTSDKDTRWLALSCFTAVKQPYLSCKTESVFCSVCDQLV